MISTITTDKLIALLIILGVVTIATMMDFIENKRKVGNLGEAHRTDKM